MKSYIDTRFRQIAAARGNNPTNNEIWAACDVIEALLWRARSDKGSVSADTINRAIIKAGAPISLDWRSFGAAQF